MNILEKVVKYIYSKPEEKIKSINAEQTNQQQKESKKDISTVNKETKKIF